MNNYHTIIAFHIICSDFTHIDNIASECVCRYYTEGVTVYTDISSVCIVVPRDKWNKIDIHRVNVCGDLLKMFD